MLTYFLFTLAGGAIGATFTALILHDKAELTRADVKVIAQFDKRTEAYLDKVRQQPFMQRGIRKGTPPTRIDLLIAVAFVANAFGTAISAVRTGWAWLKPTAMRSV